MSGLLSPLPRGVTACPRCQKAMHVDARGYGCDRCWGFAQMDLQTAPSRDLWLAYQDALAVADRAGDRMAEATDAYSAASRRVSELFRAFDAARQREESSDE